MISPLHNLDAARVVSAHSRPPSPAASTNPERRTSSGDQSPAMNLPNAIPPSREQIKESAEKVEASKAVDVPQDQFRYRFDKRIEGLVVEVIDWETGEVVRTIPPEEYIRLRAGMVDLSNPGQYV